MTTNLSFIQRIHQLEPQALAEVYDTHSPALYRYAMRLLGDVDLAEECVSETFARFLGALQRRKGPREHIKAYLFRIAHNWITDYYRRSKPEPQPLENELFLASDENVARAAFSNLRMARVRAALQKLTPDQQQVISLKFLEGWENAEIAQALNKPIGAVKSLQHRGLAALKRLLLDNDDDELS